MCSKLLFVLLQVLLVFGEDVKNSLTFVIDGTGSNRDDINHLKRGVDTILERVMRNPNSTHIENFVLVTLNNPHVVVRANTTNREEFKQALDSIDLHGDGDCSDMSVESIKKAVEVSSPRSYVYVVTDTGIQDLHLEKQITDMSINKLSQVVFVITGDCKGRSTEQVFHNMASSTNTPSNQVYDLQMRDIKKIFTYVRFKMSGWRTTLARGTVAPGTTSYIPFSVEKFMRDVLISAMGKKPAVSVTGRDGSATATKDKMKTPITHIVNLPDPEPGPYVAAVSASGPSYVHVGGTNINFQHGFAIFRPDTLAGTSVTPVKGVESYLIIELTTGGSGVELNTAQILNMDDRIFTELPLGNDKRNLYITDPFVPPDDKFKIAVKGIDETTKNEVRRVNPTAIEHQQSKII